MGIDKKEFNNIWTAIQKWMRKKHMSSLELAGLTGVSENYIQRGIATKNEWITSEFLHNLMMLLYLLRLGKEALKIRQMSLQTKNV